MTITLPLDSQEEAKLIAVARAKGVSTDELLRVALDGILARASEIPAEALSEPQSGALLVSAIQASPFKEMDLEAVRAPLPGRDIAF
jgi:hypothetical protein